MRKLRILVEHNYRDVKKYWMSQDFARNLKLHQVPIEIMYKCSAIMKSFHACLYTSGKTIDRFEMDQPSLEDFLNA